MIYAIYFQCATSRDGNLSEFKVGWLLFASEDRNFSSVGDALMVNFACHQSTHPPIKHQNHHTLMSFPFQQTMWAEK